MSLHDCRACELDLKLNTELYKRLNDAELFEIF